MSNAVTCPHCRSSLRSSRPLPAQRLVRCPDCGTHFQAGGAPPTVAAISTGPVPARTKLAPVDRPAPPAELPFPDLTSSEGEASADAPASPRPQRPTPARSRPSNFVLLFAAAVLAASVLGSGLIVAVVLLARPTPPPPAPAAPVAEKDRDEEAEQRLAAERKKLAQERADLAKERKKLAFEAAMRRGADALAKGKHEQALAAYQEALQLCPGDATALEGLTAARSGLDAAGSAGRARAEEARRNAAVKALVEQGRKAMTDKQYTVAVRSFEAARTLAPTDAGVLQGLTRAQAAADADEAEKKKLADFRARLDAGRVALVAGRPADALREFLAAQQLVPGDRDALAGQQQAQAQIALMNRQQRFDGLIAAAKQALAVRRYSDAVTALQEAVRTAPEDNDAHRALRDARVALKKARSEAAQLVARGDQAMQTGRPADAVRAYARAEQVLPEDDVATVRRGKAESALADLAFLAAVYQRLMNQATAAMATRRYLDAAAAYTQALGLFPGDPDATNGLQLAQAAADRVAQADVAARAGAAADQAARQKSAYKQQMRLGNNALGQAPFLKGQAAARAWADAEAAFDAALELVPNDPRAQAGRGKARYGRFMFEGGQAVRERRRADAVQAYTDALKERPNDQSAIAGIRIARGLRGPAGGQPPRGPGG